MTHSVIFLFYHLSFDSMHMIFKKMSFIHWFPDLDGNRSPGIQSPTPEFQNGLLNIHFGQQHGPPLMGHHVMPPIGQHGTLAPQSLHGPPNPSQQQGGVNILSLLQGAGVQPHIKENLATSNSFLKEQSTSHKLRTNCVQLAAMCHFLLSYLQFFVAMCHWICNYCLVVCCKA